MHRNTIRELLTDDDAVSPVIGVILMVAITVILAAVIRTFVIGSGTEDTPKAAMNFEYDDGTTTVTVSHQGGDRLQADRVDLRESNTAATLTENPDGLSAFTASDVVASGTYDPGETLTVVWTGGSQNAAVIAESTAPS